MDIVTFVKRVGGKLLRQQPASPRTRPGVLKEVFGHTLFQNPDDIAIDYSGYAGVSLEQVTEGELGCLIDCLQPGQTVIDLGANIGFYTLVFAQKVGPDGHVFAFEPGPRSFQLLKRNVTENKFTNVTLENQAVSNVTGTTQLFICPTGESDNRIAGLVYSEVDRPAVKMPMTRLDDYFADRTDPIDLIKMDIQGAEYMALQGMAGLLNRNEKVRIVMEYTPGCPDVSPVDLLALIRKLGFRTFDLEKYPEIEEVDDAFLLAKYPRTGGYTTLLLHR